MANLNERPLEAIKILVEGKNDTELLETMVRCLTDNEQNLLSELRKSTEYRKRAEANLEVLYGIMCFVRDRENLEVVLEKTLPAELLGHPGN